jgi:hypothetical protein
MIQGLDRPYCSDASNRRSSGRLWIEILAARHQSRRDYLERQHVRKWRTWHPIAAVVDLCLGPMLGQLAVLHL